MFPCFFLQSLLGIGIGIGSGALRNIPYANATHPQITNLVSLFSLHFDIQDSIFDIRYFSLSELTLIVSRLFLFAFDQGIFHSFSYSFGVYRSTRYHIDIQSLLFDNAL